MEIIRYPCSNTKLSFWLQEPFIQISGNFVSQWQKVASCQCFESAAISFFLGSECTSAPVSHPGRQQCISQCQMSCCQLKIWVQIFPFLSISDSILFPNTQIRRTALWSKMTKEKSVFSTPLKPGIFSKTN